jgi:hypothetical protein
VAITESDSAPTLARSLFHRVQRKTVNAFAVGLCLLLSLPVGSMLADWAHAETPGFILLCLTAPLAAVSAVCWLVGRLRN